jgi:hypothetical protein
LWRIVSSGRVGTKLCVVKTSVEGLSANAPVDNPSASQRVDGRIRVWRPRSTAFLQEHIVCTTAFGGAGVTVWGCFSLNCKLDLYVLDGTSTGVNKNNFHPTSALSATT